MARSRNIKPGFYKNEDLAECSIWARFVFPGLWMLADREGRLEDRPKRIKGELLPFDGQDMDPLLDELERFGFIIRYENEDGRFIQIAKFSTHQAPHYSEKPSVIKPPFSENPDTPQNSGNSSPSSRDDGIETPGIPPASSLVDNPLIPDSLIPDSLIPDSLIPDSGILIPESKQEPQSTIAGAAENLVEKPDHPTMIGHWVKYFVDRGLSPIACQKPPAHALFNDWLTLGIGYSQMDQFMATAVKNLKGAIPSSPVYLKSIVLDQLEQTARLVAEREKARKMIFGEEAAA